MAGSRRRAAAVAFAALTLTLVACDALLGLGQYQDVACAFNCDAGEAGEAGESGAFSHEDAEAATILETGPDTGADADASVDTGAVTMPDSGWPVPTGHEIWAHWPMPNPDAAIGPESSTPLPHAMSYDAATEAGPGVAYDAVTGLSWSRTVVPATTYQNAWMACAALDLKLGGTWRVPTRIELVSLIDFTRTTGPTIDTATFLDAGATRAWTSSAVAGDDSPSGYWGVDFGTGLTFSGGGASQVLCVRGGATQ